VFGLLPLSILASVAYLWPNIAPKGTIPGGLLIFVWGLTVISYAWTRPPWLRGAISALRRRSRRDQPADAGPETDGR
jgi:hypothetical protein